MVVQCYAVMLAEWNEVLQKEHYNHAKKLVFQVGYTSYQLVQDFFHQPYQAWILDGCANWIARRVLCFLKKVEDALHRTRVMFHFANVGKDTNTLEYILYCTNRTFYTSQVVQDFFHQQYVGSHASINMTLLQRKQLSWRYLFSIQPWLLEEGCSWKPLSQPKTPTYRNTSKGGRQMLRFFFVGWKHMH